MTPPIDKLAWLHLRERQVLGARSPALQLVLDWLKEKGQID